jgi:hypothetical protein
MPASTLAMWDVGVMEQKLLAPGSYKEFETPFILKNGENTHYGLGTYVRDVNGHRLLEHSGEVGGYVSENMVLPNDGGGIAIVVLTNEVASSAAHDIARDVAMQLVPTLQPAQTSDATGAELKTLLGELQRGTIDRSVLTPDTNDYFNADTLADFRSTLAPLGAVTNVTRTYTHARGGMAGSVYKATFANGTALSVSTYITPDGKFEQLLITGKE